MIQTSEMKRTLPMAVHGGLSTTTEVWEMLTASRDGNLEHVREMISRHPALSSCQYNYTPPLYFAVREGHLELVRELISQGGLDPTYVTYPFLEPLVMMASERGYDEIAHLLRESLETPGVGQTKGDTGAIDYQQNETERRFQKAVHHNRLSEVAELLDSNPELACNELSSWGEGTLMMPANQRNFAMLELLMRHGARVPDVSKWARAYYFKHHDVAGFLLDRGMNANHLSWQNVTLLHDMAQEGDTTKAKLLLEHGADIDPIDDEYRSTPLGLAARWGRTEIVALLLDRGADPNKAGAEWSQPIVWARKKGHNDIERSLRQAGAVG